MDLIALVIVAALIMHAWEVARDEHGHARHAAARQLGREHPDRSDAWVKRHSLYRAVAHWPRIPREVGRAIKEDRAHAKLRRLQNDTGHLRRMRDLHRETRRWRDEFRAAREQHDKEATQSGAGPATAFEDPPVPRGRHSVPATPVPPWGAPLVRPQGEPLRPGTHEPYGPPVAAGAPENGAQPGPGYRESQPGDPVAMENEDGEGARPPEPQQEPDAGGTAPPAPDQPENNQPNDGGTMADGTNGSAAATGTGEAPDFQTAETIADGHVAHATQLLSRMEQYQSDLVTTAELGGDHAVTGSLDEAMEALRNYGAAMQKHQQALAAHKAGQEYADSVQSPANSQWLQSK